MLGGLLSIYCHQVGRLARRTLRSRLCRHVDGLLVNGAHGSRPAPRKRQRERESERELQRLSGNDFRAMNSPRQHRQYKAMPKVLRDEN